MRIVFWIAFWVFLLDQGTKYLVLYTLDLINRIAIDVIDPLLNLRMAWNRGVNFGLFAGFDLRWVLIGVAFAIVAGVLWWMARWAISSTCPAAVSRALSPSTSPTWRSSPGRSGSSSLRGIRRMPATGAGAGRAGARRRRDARRGLR